MAYTVLFYSKFKYDSHEPVQVVRTPETWVRGKLEPT